MDLELKKDKFLSDHFDTKTYINSFLKTNQDTELDIIIFKLKMIQREFAHEIDLNMNNIQKSNKTQEDDLKNVKIINTNITNKLDDITKNLLEPNK